MKNLAMHSGTTVWKNNNNVKNYSKLFFKHIRVIYFKVFDCIFQRIKLENSI